jgi:RHS repeat-associated protein
VDTNSSDSTYGMASDTEASDGNGNQTYDGTQAYTYDAWNRLMTVSHAYRDGSGTLQHGQAFDTMAYDARGRRILKAVNGTGAWDCTYHYYLAGDSVVEEQNGSAQPIKQYVWGKKYIDELVQTSLNSNPTGQTTCDTSYWACQDANWNVLGIINGSGTLTERYEYTPYGQRQVLFSPGGNDPLCYAPTVASRRFVASGSTTEPWGICDIGHQGLFGDAESGQVFDRARQLSQETGRFISKDPMGYIDGLQPFQYELSRPLIKLDPRGTNNLTVPDKSKMVGPLADGHGEWFYQEGTTIPGHLTMAVIAYAADKNQICCHKIGIVQFVTRINNNTKKTWTDMNGDAYPWQVDNNENGKVLFYQDNPNTETDWGDVCNGSFNEWDAISDEPGIHRGTTFKARDFAVCNDGGSAHNGQVLGGAEWSGTANDAGTVVFDGFSLVGLTDEFVQLSGGRLKPWK